MIEKGEILIVDKMREWEWNKELLNKEMREWEQKKEIDRERENTCLVWWEERIDINSTRMENRDKADEYSARKERKKER